jgi:hypothetical protein
LSFEVEECKPLVVGTHVRRAAVATCLVARRRAWAAVETKTGRPPKGAHYIGLSGEDLLFMVGSGAYTGPLFVSN